MSGVPLADRRGTSYLLTGRSIERKTLHKVVNGWTEAAGSGPCIQDQGQSCSLYGPTKAKLMTARTYLLFIYKKYIWLSS